MRVVFLVFPGFQSLDLTGPLESTALPVDVIARTCGFGTPETMHRSFRRRISVTPGAYRRRFSAH